MACPHGDEIVAGNFPSADAEVKSAISPKLLSNRTVFVFVLTTVMVQCYDDDEMLLLLGFQLILYVMWLYKLCKGKTKRATINFFKSPSKPLGCCTGHFFQIKKNDNLVLDWDATVCQVLGDTKRDSCI